MRPIDDPITEPPVTTPPTVTDPITGTPVEPGPAPSLTSGPIYEYKTALGRYPGNNKQWWVAKADADDPDSSIKAGDFLPKILAKFFSGNNRAPRGHYIINALRKNRAAVSGISNIPTVEAGERPSSVTFFSGRAWFGCKSTVYYSQILDSFGAYKAGLCYQEADPTAEDISDLIATDGGVVEIPEADHIEALQPIANGVVVFAQNGAWFVSGGDQSFSALNISVSKISTIGTKSPQSIITIDDTIFWWSEIGIQALQQASGQFGPIPGRFGNTNISEQTIQTFFNNIPPDSKHLTKAVYDDNNNVVYWLFSTSASRPNEYDSVLAYDLTLQAFYPWKVSGYGETYDPRIIGAFLDKGYFESNSFELVTDDGIAVTDDGEDVTVDISQYGIKPSAVYYLTAVNNSITVSAPVDYNYVDWRAYDGEGLLYDSFIETGYELNNDMMRDKQVVYLFAHFRRTESDVGDNPSSCKLVTKWDWADSRNTSKWSREIEAYRPRTINLTDVVVSKNKVRGSGKAVQFRFGTNEPGKTFDLLGWSVAFSGVTEP